VALNAAAALRDARITLNALAQRANARALLPPWRRALVRRACAAAQRAIRQKAAKIASLQRNKAGISAWQKRYQKQTGSIALWRWRRAAASADGGGAGG